MTNKLDDDSEDVQEHLDRFSKFYKKGILNYQDHNKFVLNIGYYAEQAGVPEQFLYKSTKKILEAKDKKYVDNWYELESSGISGAVFYKEQSNNMQRMYSILGLLLRNYIDVKMITAQFLIKNLKKGISLDNTVVCIPNFCMSKESGGNIPSWESAYLLGWLLARHGNNKQTIIYAESKNILLDQYGSVLKNHIDNNFKELN